MKLMKKPGILMLAVLILALASCVTKPKGNNLEQGRQNARNAERDMQRNFNK